jgi:glycosyltransferase involved in cell wall biosynthesis
MHIVNIMFARGGGGIEQAFVDYCEALRDRGHQVTAIVYPGAVVHQQLLQLSIPIVTMRNIGEWDIFAIRALRKHLQRIAPDAIIAHANRAYVLTNRANKKMFPLVGVVHKYGVQRYRHASALFTTTRDLFYHLTEQGIEESRVHIIPNMVRCQALPQRGLRNQPPMIGTMGRFVAKKGFDVYVEALRQLKEKGYKFCAVLGGEGEESSALKKQAHAAGLTDVLTFPGWVNDKQEFYSHIDIFCLPSLHEPFGIVLLEAFVFGAPVVATDSEGPRDIITPNYDALLVKKGDATALANALAKLLDDEKYANDLAANGFVKAKMRYSMEVVAGQIEVALNKVISNWKSIKGI